MIRFVGIILSKKKKIKYALLKIFGIGLASSNQILRTANIDPNKISIELTPKNLIQIRKIIDSKYIIEKRLQEQIFKNIKHLITIKCLRGKRHKLNLPVHGQRTRTNARTKRGKKKTVSGQNKK